MDDNNVDFIYRETLEEKIIECLVECYKVNHRCAIDIYYKSKLASQIAKGKYDGANVDYKILVKDLIESERELFS